MLSRIEISKENLIHNIKEVRNKLPQGTRLTAVVKANAYGHGLKEIVEQSKDYVDSFQVDDINELIEIRKYTSKEVFVFGYVELEQLSHLIELNGTLGVYNIETLELLNSEGQKRGKVVPFHLKIDALLGRQGVLIKDVNSFIKKIKELEYIKLESLYSHFSNIEDVENLEHAKKQAEELLKIKDIFNSAGFLNLTHHISATSGFLVDRELNGTGSLIRLGIGMYGCWPSKLLEEKYGSSFNLKPVLSWFTKIAQVKTIAKGFPVGYGLTFVASKEMSIAIVPQGYSDGYDRGFSNNSVVLVRGKRCPLIGRVAMNMFAIDVTGIGAQLEDEVVLIGNQEEESITAEELASYIDTINYEVLARISPLLDRVVKW
jgi:alanine racemase